MLLIKVSGQKGKNRSMYWPGDSHHFPRGPDRANIGWGDRKEKEGGTANCSASTSVLVPS